MIRKSKRLVAVIMVLAALTFVAAAPAQAGPRLNCAATGNVALTPNGDAWAWQVSGLGLCLDSLSGPFQMIFNGAGASDSLGLCDGLLVTNLKILVTITTLNLRTGVVKNISEKWIATVSVFPLATPFLIAGGQNGLGAIFTRILLNCPPGGVSAATFAFTTSS